MVATSGGFPYPTGTDKPCDSWKTWRDMAAVLDGRLTALNDDVNRTARARPMCKVSTTTPTLLKIDPANPTQGYPYVQWDTVEVDTDNIVDLGRSTDVIWPKRAGKWWLRAVLEWDPVSTTFAEVHMLAWITSGTTGSVEADVALAEPAWTLYNTAVVIDKHADVDPQPGIDYTFGLTATGGGPIAGKEPTVKYASLTAVWLGDLP